MFAVLKKCVSACQSLSKALARKSGGWCLYGGILGRQDIRNRAISQSI